MTKLAHIEAVADGAAELVDEETQAARREAYADRVLNRLERLRARAEAKANEGNALVAAADKGASVIPFGQPILVGHHSEKRDRNYRERLRKKWDKGFATMKEARDLDRRAHAAEHNTAISGDDPDAIEKLRAKAKAIQAQIDRAREVNTTIRTAQRHATKEGLDLEASRAKVSGALRDMGLSETAARELALPDFAGRVGIPSYRLSNLRGQLKQVADRVTVLARRATEAQAGPKEEQVGPVRIVEEDNRVRLFFPGKPSETIRSALKSAGFRWAPSVGAWMRHPGDWAWLEARRIAAMLPP